MRHRRVGICGFAVVCLAVADTERVRRAPRIPRPMRWHLDQLDDRADLRLPGGQHELERAPDHVEQPPVHGGTALATVVMDNRTTTARWYELDVTAYVAQEKAAGRHLVSLALRNDARSSPSDQFNSKEAGTNRPELVVVP